MKILKIEKTLYIFLIFCTIFSAHAQMTPQRKEIYHCAPNQAHPEVEGTRIYQSNFGQNKFHEIEVLILKDGMRSSYFKKVHLNSTYGGRILTFGTGNFRVRIDHVYPSRGKFKTFSRIPRYNIHSKQWSCKKS
jgi:hypothetical protein